MTPTKFCSLCLRVQVLLKMLTHPLRSFSALVEAQASSLCEDRLIKLNTLAGEDKEQAQGEIDFLVELNQRFSQLEAMRLTYQDMNSSAEPGTKTANPTLAQYGTAGTETLNPTTHHLLLKASKQEKQEEVLALKEN